MLAICIAGVVSCTASDADDSEATEPPSSTAPVESAATVVASTAGPATAPTTTEAGVVDLAEAVCGRKGTEQVGQLQNLDIDEASGLVASRRYDGVLWTHNDGREGVLYGLSATGEDLGGHPLSIDGIDDIEDIALVPTPDGFDILLADIGDNGSNRESIRIYRFAEPDPAAPGSVDAVEVLEFTYPDRAHNAETLLVDEAIGQLVIVTKEQFGPSGEPDDRGATGASFVFVGPLGGGEGPVELVSAGTIDMTALEQRRVESPSHPFGILGFAGVPTGGDVSADGSLIAIRTYETVWLWDRAAGQGIASSLAGDPCEVRVVPEVQGEAVAFDGGSITTILTVGELAGARLHRLAI